MSHCAMRRCSSSSQAECGLPSGRLPRSLAGKSFTASSKRMWAWPPSRSSTRWSRRSFTEQILYRLRDVVRRVAVGRAVVLADVAVLVGDRELGRVQQRLGDRLRGAAGGELEAVDGEVNDLVAPAGEEGPPRIVAETGRVVAEDLRRVAGRVDADGDEADRRVFVDLLREL